MKDTLIEIENSLQGINSKVDEAENQVSDLEHQEAKKQPVRKGKRRKMRILYRAFGITSSITFTSWVCRKEKRERKKLETI